MSVESVLSTDFAKIFFSTLCISFILTYYVIRKKKIKWRTNLMDCFAAWVITASICVTFVFAIIPAFCYLLCGNWLNTPWAVLVDYQQRFFTFLGTTLIFVIAVEGLIKMKFR